jgi:hypothetical protein
VFSAIAWAVSGTPCVLQATTGVPCPGCGLTRAVFMAFRGDFEGAFQMHPLFIAGVAILLALPFLAWRFPGFLDSRTFRLVGMTVIVLFLAVYAVRMISGFPAVPPMVYNDHSFLGRILSMAHWIG